MNRVPQPLIMTLAVSDGQRIFVIRYSSPGNQLRTLRDNRNVHAIREVDGQCEQLPDDAVIVLSEPIDEVSEHWDEIPEATRLSVAGGKVT